MTSRSNWLFILLLPFTFGCAAAALTVAGASIGVDYSITNVAYKTFNHRMDDVDDATVRALKKLGIKIADRYNYNGRRHFQAFAKDRDIRIDLERITAQTTQIRVDARTWPFFKDKATASEIIYQVFKILDSNGAIAESDG